MRVSTAWLRQICQYHRLQNVVQERALYSTQAFLDRFVNHEKAGVPSGAGTSGEQGFDLNRMHRLLDAVDSPQAALPVVHVAGTKGKGSVSTLLSCILAAAGYRVGTYTSPHIRDIRERIAINDVPISQADFDSLSEAHQSSIEASQSQPEGAPTHFEVLTALALRHFKDQQVDLAVVEAGLGGATDATNVFTPDTLRVAVITELGREHETALGVGLTRIAAAKAGIFKEGRPITVHKGLDKDLEDWQNGCTVDMRLLGEHHCHNAAAAVAAALQLHGQGWTMITGKAIVEGLHHAHLLGRFQVTCLEEPESPWVVLDGAHTPASARALASTLRQAFPQEGHPVALVVGMAADKHHREVLQALRRTNPILVVFVSVPIAGSKERSVAPGTLAAHWQMASMDDRRRGQRCRTTIQASMMAAVDKARTELAAVKPGAGVVCICGSLHTVAEAFNVLPLQAQLCR
ncbi:hypothetical protein WJX73_008574 [Symbiochloris irregularis]|uniref:Folylpolyglutamate synthase n=1 Tax=Symbiochloris irregularis TaxID=706552 RepID=A0AAW1PMJ4_9CHLO